MAIPVHLQVFEGPLDLLLHLIDKNKVDIYDIPVALITDQYMEYIDEMKRQDMNVMSEFLVMAATLLDIKCRMLLPREVNGEGEEEDPREEMVRQLLEYKMYKYMSYELKDRQMDADRVLYRPMTMPKEIGGYRPPIDYGQLIGDMTLSKLSGIFKSMMKRQAEKIDPIRSSFGRIEREEIDMDEKTSYIESYASEHREFSFRSLLQKQGSKMEMVITFLVVLEFMKMGKFFVRQDHLFDDILITYREAA